MFILAQLALAQPVHITTCDDGVALVAAIVDASDTQRVVDARALTLAAATGLAEELGGAVVDTSTGPAVSLGACSKSGTKERLSSIARGQASPEEWLRTKAGLTPDTWAARPVAHIPVVEVLTGSDRGVRGWSVQDAAGVSAFGTVAVREAPTWVEVVEGEDGAWLGFAPTEHGLAVVWLADGEVTGNLSRVPVVASRQRPTLPARLDPGFALMRLNV